MKHKLAMELLQTARNRTVGPSCVHIKTTFTNTILNDDDDELEIVMSSKHTMLSLCLSVMYFLR